MQLSHLDIPSRRQSMPRYVYRNAVDDIDHQLGEFPGAVDEISGLNHDILIQDLDIAGRQ